MTYSHDQNAEQILDIIFDVFTSKLLVWGYIGLLIWSFFSSLNPWNLLVAGLFLLWNVNRH